MPKNKEEKVLRTRLPLELECEMFKFVKPQTQRKLIWRMGRGIYGMFGQKLLAKYKRLSNPKKNRWIGTNTEAKISSDGLKVHNDTKEFGLHVIAAQAFPIAGVVHWPPGAILYYYEITDLTTSPSSTQNRFCVGLSTAGSLTHYYHWLGGAFHTYGLYHGDKYCYLSNYKLAFKWPDGAIEPKWNETGDVVGCGLLLDAKNQLFIFFTLNGILMGKQCKINMNYHIWSIDHLYPTVRLVSSTTLEANFGDDPDNKPFKYDIQKCPGLVFKFQ